MKHKTRTKAMSWLLSLALALSLVPGMGLTAYAADNFSSLKNTTTVVKFDNKDWYLIDYDTSTVTLLSKECVGASAYNAPPIYVEYENSKIKEAVDTYYATLTESAKSAVKDGKMFLLTTEQAQTIYLANPDVLKCSQADGAIANLWWLGSPGSTTHDAAGVSGGDGYVYVNGDTAAQPYGVRPALQLDLSKVTFDSATNTFTVVEEPSTYTLNIPSELNVSGSGWNDAGGISATGTLASGKKLTVTASSDGEFALVNQSDDTQKVGYKLATASTDTASTTSWEFTELSSTVTKKDMGIIVEDYSTKPAGTYTDTVTFTAKVESAGNIVTLSTLTDNYEAQSGDILTGTLDGATQHYKISIADGATVTLKDVNITNLGKNCNWAGITCPGDAKLILKGTNTVCAGRDDEDYNNYPGIWIKQDKTLTIDGDGSLTAYSNANAAYGAGIGGGFNIPCGNIVIDGGTITATGGTSAAGIGSGYSASCGSITINGGTIVAVGGWTAAGIGSAGRERPDDGSAASCGNITIANTVTEVTATAGRDSTNSIGAGAYGTCGTVTIGGNVGAISENPYTYQP